MAGHVLGYLGLGDPEPRQVLGQVSQVLGVRVAVLRAPSVRLHVDVVPGDAVVPLRGDGAAHGEHEPLAPGQVHAVQRPGEGVRPGSEQGLPLALAGVRQEGHPGEVGGRVGDPGLGVLGALHLQVRESHTGRDCSN